MSESELASLNQPRRMSNNAMQQLPTRLPIIEPTSGNLKRWWHDIVANLTILLSEVK